MKADLPQTGREGVFGSHDGGSLISLLARAWLEILTAAAISLSCVVWERPRSLASSLSLII